VMGSTMKSDRRSWTVLLLTLLPGLIFAKASGQKAKPETLEAIAIGVSVNPADGSYTILDSATKTPVLHARVAAEVDHRWLRSSDYGQHSIRREPTSNERGPETKLTVSNTGFSGHPDLIYTLELHSNPDFLTIAVAVRNNGANPTTVQAIRSVEAIGPRIVDLGAPDASDRVLSDSFSEDRPGIKIHDLPDAANGMHRAVGSQLIYNRDTKRNLFLGALTSEKFLTVLRLHVDKDRVASYEVDSTGTTELELENSLETSSAEDQMELSLPVAPGADLASEKLLISTGTDYHQQLETYGSLIRELHHARVSAPTFAGWWSWTAYYFGLNQATALTNAKWLAQNLKNLGYTFFHIDEGYQYARGEYTTPDAELFPAGMNALESRVRALGLTPGIWTAPFEVSERSWVYENHKDWLVHNAAGQPIHAGWVIGREPRLDPLYILDCTNPGAQGYLRKTYTTLTRDWGIRYIKLDFMDDSAIEGAYYKPNTTALEAQRVGLQIIREAVGEDVLLDKDGSPMLNPVGIVDTGRISVDTGHTFGSSKEAAPGIAARYYMNRNFYIADPDAFTVSRQTVDEQEWHGGKRPLTLDEAKVSIALAAIAGGMYEIGDDLPTLGADADRMALVKNQDLFNMARLGRASRPLDLMSYTPEDGMPSIFLGQESKRQAILTVFNWTEKPIAHNLDLARDLGLQLRGHNQVVDVLDSGAAAGANLDAISFQLAPHSVKVLKIIDDSIPAAAPAVRVHAPETAEAGSSVEFSAEADPAGVPVLAYRWDFGDGTSAEGAAVHHAYTHTGDFSVHLLANGLDGLPLEKSVSVKVQGKIDTRFAPSRKKRLILSPNSP
jgi:alpha-galactosidase